MPIATPEQYAQMLDSAKKGGYAFPAINCTSSETINAAIKGFADAGSDGIIQFSTGGAEFGSGLGVKDMVTGAVALAEFAHVVAEKYDAVSAEEESVAGTYQDGLSDWADEVERNRTQLTSWDIDAFWQVVHEGRNGRPVGPASRIFVDQ